MVYTWYSLTFPRGITQAQVLPWVRSLAARPRRGLLGHSDPVILEIETSHAFRWTLGVSGRDAEAILSQFRMLLPSVRLTVLDQRQLATLQRAVELRLNTFRRPLRSDIADTSSGSLLAALQTTRSSEHLLLQWIIGPWLPRPVVKRTGSLRPGPVAEQLIRQLAMDTEDASTYRKKLAEPLLGTALRIGVAAPSVGRERHLLQRVIGSLQLSRQPGVGLVTRLTSSRTVISRIERLACPLISWPVPINASELTAVLGWPIGNPALPGVEYVSQRQLPPAAGTLVTQEVLDRSPTEYRVIARATFPGREGLLHLRAKDALHHLHVIGPTGTGKSTLLARLIESDIAAGRGVVVIEPKGDLIEHVLDRIPANRINDVVLLDPADLVEPVGLNVLASSSAGSELVADQLVHVFRELYKDSWGPRTQDILTAGLLTLTQVGGQTICELPVLLTNSGYRRRIVSRLNDHLALGPFWAWFESLSDPARTEVIGPVLNKLRAFTYRRAIRSMLGQPQAAFRMSSVFTERRILLVNLAKGSIGPESARLLGSLLFSAFWQAGLGRTAVSPERRHVVSVYVDEFQDYLHLPTEFGDVMAQARGLGLALTLAHQHLGQLTPTVKAAILANARSRVVFQTGTTDAGPLAAALGGGLTADDLQGLGAFEVYASVVRGGSPASPASGLTLAPSPALGSTEEVRALSREQYGRPLAEIEADLIARQIGEEPDAGLGGRRRRTA